MKQVSYAKRSVKIVYSEIPCIAGKLRNSVARYTISHLVQKKGQRHRAECRIRNAHRVLSRSCNVHKGGVSSFGKYVRRGLLVLIKSALSTVQVCQLYNQDD